MPPAFTTLSAPPLRVEPMTGSTSSIPFVESRDAVTRTHPFDPRDEISTARGDGWRRFVGPARPLVPVVFVNQRHDDRPISGPRRLPHRAQVGSDFAITSHVNHPTTH